MLRQFPGQYQILIPGTPVFLQKLFSHYSILPICRFFLIDFQVWQIIISMQCVVQSVLCLLCSSFIRISGYLPLFDTLYLFLILSVYVHLKVCDTGSYLLPCIVGTYTNSTPPLRTALSSSYWVLYTLCIFLSIHLPLIFHTVLPIVQCTSLLNQSNMPCFTKLALHIIRCACVFITPLFV